TPHRQRVFVRYEPQRTKARTLEPAREQHTERLVRKPPFERIAEKVMPVAAREGLDQQLTRPRHERPPFLNFQPLTDLVRQRPPFITIRNDLSHAIGEIRRERKFSALVGRHRASL